MEFLWVPPQLECPDAVPDGYNGPPGSKQTLVVKVYPEMPPNTFMYVCFKLNFQFSLLDAEMRDESFHIVLCFTSSHRPRQWREKEKQLEQQRKVSVI